MSRIGETFDQWVDRNGFRRRLNYLERRLYIERHEPGIVAAERIYRLTAKGRLRVLGGRDPEGRWNREWDGLWRKVFYDIPEVEHQARRQLREFLVAEHFGVIQRSVMISPDALGKEIKKLADGGKAVRSLFTFAGRPASGETDASIVSEAWDFKEINRGYERCLEVLRRADRVGASAEARAKWMAEEQAAWLAAVGGDPLLPACLLPRGYLGREVWERRRVKLAKWAGSSVHVPINLL